MAIDLSSAKRFDCVIQVFAINDFYITFVDKVSQVINDELNALTVNEGINLNKDIYSSGYYFELIPNWDKQCVAQCIKNFITEQGLSVDIIHS